MLTVTPVKGLPEFVAGDDLPGMLADAVAGSLVAGDIVVVTSKIVSKAEGRQVAAADREDAITSQTVRLVAQRGATRIVENPQGLVMAAAGVDASNAPDGIVLPDRASDWASLLYMALIPGALGIVGQTWAQAHLPPTRTAIVMSMEPVFAAFFAVLLGGESLTSRMLLGGAFVVAAMLVVELGPRRHVEGEVTHLTV